MSYRNTTKGARAIHLTNGGYVLVEAGATADIPEGKVRRLGPGLVLADSEIPPLPKDLAKKAKATGAKAPAKSELATARGEYKARFGKQPGPRWSVAEIREKIAAA
jgi:hypothetical protein